MDEESPSRLEVWVSLAGIVVTAVYLVVVVEIQTQGDLHRWVGHKVAGPRRWLEARRRARRESAWVVWEAWCAMLGEQP